MIIIIATVQVRPEHLAAALEQSHQHVVRSRAEPGCLSHAVHQDHEDPNRLVFVERWADREAMNNHFGVPAARAFSKGLSNMADAPAELSIYEAEPLR